MLEERFPNAKENILQSATFLAEANLIYEQRITQIKKKLVEQTSENTWRLPIRMLKNYEPRKTILYELFKDFGLVRSQLPELIKLLEADNGARLELEFFVVYKDRNFLLVQEVSEHLETTNGVNVFIENENGSIDLPTGKLSWELIDKPLKSVKFDKNIATLDASNIELPFKVRAPKEGDYFYPLGMKKKKKISRYFIDNKYSPMDKERALLLEMIPKTGGGKKRIMWLIGDRIDNRFRISEGTTSYYKIVFKS